MAHIAFVTDREHPGGSEDDRLALPFLGLHHVSFPAWDDASVAWDRLDAIVLRSTWDYVASFAAFQAWLLRLPGNRLWNPLSLVNGNLSKTYLLGLSARGIPTISTVFVAAEMPLQPHLDRWGTIVVKPVVSAGGRLTFRVGPEERDAVESVMRASQERFMIQPYVGAVEEDGEWSLLYFSGEFSHAVRKLPAKGNFLVQEEHGGVQRGAEASEAQRKVAEAALKTLPLTPLYARVDLLAGAEGPALVEMELVEPSLYLHCSEEAPARFARAIRGLPGVG